MMGKPEIIPGQKSAWEKCAAEFAPARFPRSPFLDPATDLLISENDCRKANVNPSHKQIIWSAAHCSQTGGVAPFFNELS
jgi:hypothetical protein